MKPMSKAMPRAVLAVVASGILLCAIAQAAEAAAIKSPAGSALGTAAKAQPITTDSGGCRPGGHSSCGGYRGGLAGYGNFRGGGATLRHEPVHAN
jgi:hypothetical protein